MCECERVYSPTNWYHRALRFKDPIEGAAMAFIHTLPVLDGKNYDQWVVRMEVILGIVKEGNSEKEKDDAAIMKKDFKAKCLLHQCVDLVVFEKIAKASTTKEAWEILQKAFGNAGKTKKVKLQSLRRQYELLSMSDQETVADYFNRMQLLVNSMKTCGEVQLKKKKENLFVYICIIF